jgi:predicted GH43/DUF377 family glycosyl hydrolase
MSSNKILFDKKGLIFDVRNVKWINSYAWVPTAHQIENTNKAIIFFAARNSLNESDTSYFIYNLDKMKITKIAQGPILKRGKLGNFDDSAAIPSHLIKIRRKFYLYYVGWTQGKKVPFFSSLGLATANKITGPYKKISNAPIIGKSKYDPLFVATCFVQKIKKGFCMYYTSNMSWKMINNIPKPKYLIKKCFSKDGIKWIANNKKIIKFEKNTEVAITRPWVLKLREKFVMFFSLKKNNYTIETSISKDGKSWKRNKIFLFREENKINFDSKAQEYASIIKYKKKLFMFYNGNEYGKKGIGLAVAKFND